MNVSDLVAVIQQIANMRDIPLPTTGVVVPGSYDPERGTVHVLVGSTATLMDSSDPNSDATYHKPVQVLTGHIGTQGGPIGMERVLLIPTDDGWRAMFEHDSDDSPNAQPGEWHAHLRDTDQSRVTVCFVAVQQDATRVSHDQKCVVIAPIVVLSKEDAVDGEQIVRKKDLQQAVDDAIANTQDALNQLANMVQAGSGVPAPNIDSVTAEASDTSYSG